MDSMQCPDTGPGRGGPGASVRLVACPECQLPAEITERFWLDSTDGPVLHVCVSCVDGHYFRMPADGLTPDAEPPAPAPAAGFTRMPGQLGTVWSALPERLGDAGAVQEAAEVRDAAAVRGAEATASLA
jgi:hypothetical protein